LAILFFIKKLIKVIYNPEKSLISIHIPKAGGTSFRQVLKHWFGNKLLFHYFDEPNKRMPEQHELLPGICIHGHFNARRGFGIMNYYSDADQFVTFLRDPFEILVSRYYYVKMREKAGTSFRDGKPTALSDNVNDFLKAEIYNPDYTPNILDFFPESLNESNFRQVIDHKFIFIGFMDYYQDSIDRLASLLNFPQINAPFENKSERFGEVDPSLRNLFAESHQLEYDVYNYARALYLE